MARPRVVVMTDIANEPDDQMSMVRFLVYSNQFDVEGLVATTSTWMKNKVRPDVIQTVVDAYGQVQPNLLQHAPGFPAAAALRGGRGIGPAGVRHGRGRAGQDARGRRAASFAPRAKDDPRPLWVLAWGGANTLAQALLGRARAADAGRARGDRRRSCASTRSRIRTMPAPWIRREFPALHYIAMPSTPDGEQYASATWTGISGDRFYKNAPGADFTTFTDAWVNANIREQGPARQAVSRIPCCIHEGDTPAFLGLIDNGLASFMSPTYGGWGGRYVWRQPSRRAASLLDAGRRLVSGAATTRGTRSLASTGRTYTSDQATIWRWRTAFQHDFAARMDWTIKDARGREPQPAGRRERPAGHGAAS